jgi:acyl-CoA reductase-like NAD-dependent aldehyde dehydrogenase
MYGSLRGTPEYERQYSLLAEAEKEGQMVIRGESDPTTKRMGISIVLLPEASKVPKIKIVEEEIFGPIIPIIPVEVGWRGSYTTRRILRLGNELGD